jgi:hypothetical protein
MAVVNALLAFSIEREMTNWALLHTLIVVEEEEVVLADQALVKLVLIALLAVSIGVAKNTSVISGSFD